MKFPVTMNFQEDIIGTVELELPDKEFEERLSRLIANGELVFAPAYMRTWEEVDGKPAITDMQLVGVSLIPSGFNINENEQLKYERGRNKE